MSVIPCGGCGSTLKAKLIHRSPFFVCASISISSSAERVMLANRDRLTRLSAEAFGALYDGESAALANLAIVWKRVAELASLDPRFSRYLDERETVKSSLC